MNDKRPNLERVGLFAAITRTVVLKYRFWFAATNNNACLSVLLLLPKRLLYYSCSIKVILPSKFVACLMSTRVHLVEEHPVSLDTTYPLRQKGARYDMYCSGMYTYAWHSTPSYI